MIAWIKRMFGKKSSVAVLAVCKCDYCNYLRSGKA